MYFKVWTIGNGGRESHHKYIWVSDDYPDYVDFNDDEQMGEHFDTIMSPLPASIRRICWEPVTELPQKKIADLIEGLEEQIKHCADKINYLKQLKVKDEEQTS